MPEQEELKLVVTLDDQASAKLAGLQAALSKLGSASGGMGQMGAQAQTAAKGAEVLQSSLTALASRAGFIGGVVSGVTSELTKMGVEILKRATDLNRLSLEMNALSNSARGMGVSVTQLESDLHRFRQVGVSVESATRQLQNFNDAMADLSTVQGQVRSKIISGGFLPFEQMSRFLKESEVLKPEEQLKFWSNVTKEVEKYNTARYGSQEGAKRTREFQQRAFGTENLQLLLDQQEKITAEYTKYKNIRDDDTKVHVKQIADIDKAYGDIADALGGIVIHLGLATGATTVWQGIVEGVAHTLQQVLVDMKHLEDIRSGKVTSKTPYTAPEGTPDYNTAMPQPFMSGVVGGGGGGNWDSRGFTRSGGEFWRNLKGRSDVDIEDRRDLDENTEETKKLTNELERLNDTLEGRSATGGWGGGVGGGGGGRGPMFGPGIGPGAGPSDRGGDGGGGGGGGGGGAGPSPGSPAKMNDERGVPVDPETMKEAETLGRAGDVGGLQKLFASKGYRMGGAACGIVASAYAKSAGFKPPEGGAVATNWRKWGVEATPEDINKEGHPFGSMVGVSKLGTYGSARGRPLATGQTGGHVMQAIPGTYDPKTGTALFVDQYGGRDKGVHRRPVASMDYRFAGGSAVEEAARRGGAQPATTAAGPVGGGDDASVLSEAAQWVRDKESFTPRNEPDFGRRKIGYGTDPKGRTSITEPEARKEEEDYLAGSLARINAMNPNLTRGQKIALASLDFNTGWTKKSGDKNDALRAAVKAGDMGAARELFTTYTHVGGPHGRVVKGLVTRRQEELSVFDRPDQQRPGGASSIDLAAAKRRAGIMDGEGRKLDGDSQSVTVNGKGQLDVKVSAPPGTRVKANGDGLLKDTRVQQETQMTPASKQGKLTEIEAD